ncbi:unnamed protein product, partial [Choristocarpus tenellus]
MFTVVLLVQFSYGVRAFADMQEAGFAPQENSYMFLLRDMANREAYVDAFALVKDMVARGIHPRLRSYALTIKGLCDKVSM